LRDDQQTTNQKKRKIFRLVRDFKQKISHKGVCKQNLNRKIEEIRNMIRDLEMLEEKCSRTKDGKILY